MATITRQPFVINGGPDDPDDDDEGDDNLPDDTEDGDAPVLRNFPISPERAQKLAGAVRAGVALGAQALTAAQQLQEQFRQVSQLWGDATKRR